jgi:hypothetical protein
VLPTILIPSQLQFSVVNPFISFSLLDTVLAHRNIAVRWCTPNVTKSFTNCFSIQASYQPRTLEIMVEITDRDRPGDQVNLDVPIFSTPQYHVSYGDDYTLQWTPPVGSKELAVALSYHFPLQKDLESKMQAAIKVFLHHEQQSPPPIIEQVKLSCVEQSTMPQQLSTMPAESSMASGLEIRPQRCRY